VKQLIQGSALGCDPGLETHARRDSGPGAKLPAGRPFARTVLREFLWLAVILVVHGCATPVVVVPPPSAGEPIVPVYLVGQGWHTGIVIRRADIPQGSWPEAGDFPQAEYVVVGWGDRDYYQAPGPAGWLAVKAALAPTPSVLHVVGFRGPVAEYFRVNEVVELAVSPRGLQGLVQYIHDAHAREGTQVVAPLGPELYGDGRFYPGREQFHLFRTCNVWAARALRAAGLPVRDAIRRKGLMAQARRLGRLLQAAPGD